MNHPAILPEEPPSVVDIASRTYPAPVKPKRPQHKPNHEPTLHEIWNVATKQIQAGWSDDEEVRRRGAGRNPDVAYRPASIEREDE